jgi:hypothetical protein
MESNFEFPLDVFPLKLKNAILDLKESLDYPIEFTASSMLYASSIAIGNSYHIQRKKGYNINCSLWLVLVGRSGMVKSHPLKFAVKPLIDRDYEHYQRFQNEKTEYNRAQNSTKDKSEEAIEIAEPILTQHIMKDITPEKLMEILSNNPRGVGIYVDELREWINNFERYSKSGNVEMYLSMWQGHPVAVDRKSGSLRVHIPFVPIAGTIQTTLLNELFKGDKSDNGFMDRFLICNPDLKRTYTEDKEPKDETFSIWDFIINQILKTPIIIDEFGIPKPQVLQYANECKNELTNWEKRNISKINHSPNEEASAHSKLEQYIHRFALIFQVLAHILEDEPIDKIYYTALKRAILLVEYFENTIICLKGEQVQNKLSQKLGGKANKIEWYTKLENEFKTHEAQALYAEIEGSNKSDRSVETWLNDKELFDKISRGLYKKIYK